MTHVDFFDSLDIYFESDIAMGFHPGCLLHVSLYYVVVFLLALGWEVFADERADEI